MKIKVGVIFDQKTSVGGGFTQSFEVVKFLKNNSNEFFEPIFFTIFKENLGLFNDEDIDVKLISLNIFQKLFMKLSTVIQSNYFQKIYNKLFGMNSFEKILFKNNIDIVYFLSPSSWSLYLNKINYVITVWDICHRDHPEFPEVNNDKIFEEREKLFSRSLPKANTIIVDSLYTKINLIKFYNLNESNIEIIEFKNRFNTKIFNLNKDYLINKYKIKNKFLFYPAQFWPHKNHIYILEGVNILKKKFNITLDIIFTGKDKGNLKNLKDFSKNYNLFKNVYFLNFVNDEELAFFYMNSLALVMPSYFGPSNIPPLEAFYYKTPVIYTNFDNLSDKFIDCVYPINLDDPSDLAKAIYTIIHDDKLKQKKISNGLNYLKNREANEVNDIKVYNKIFKKFSIKLKTWKGN